MSTAYDTADKRERARTQATAGRSVWGKYDAPELERAALGAMMRGPGWRSAVREYLRRDQLVDARHRAIWRVIEQVEAAGDEPGYLEMMTALHATPSGVRDGETMFEHIGGIGVLDACETLAPPSVEMIPAMCQRVVTLWQLRELRLGLGKISGRIVQTDDPNDVLADVESLRGRVVDVAADNGLGAISARRRADELVDHVERHLDAEPGADRLYTGLAPVDALVDGFQRGSYVLLSSYSKHGKTTIGSAIIAGMMARHDDLVVNIHQCEVRALVQTARVVAASSPSARVNQGWLTKPDRVPRSQRADFARDVIQAAAHFGEQTAYIEDPGIISIEHVEERARQLRARHPTAPVVMMVDYFQRMTTREGGRKFDQLEDISGRLIDLAKRHDILMLVLSQYTESDSMEAPVKMPRAGQIRHCKTARDDCDLLLTWHRPLWADPVDGRFGVLEAAAAREIETGHVLVDLDLGQGDVKTWTRDEPWYGDDLVTRQIALHTGRVEVAQ